jgi:hypothetical protein
VVVHGDRIFVVGGAGGGRGIERPVGELAGQPHPTAPPTRESLALCTVSRTIESGTPVSITTT